MEKDIVCSEAELMSAANKILNYGDFLSRTISSYTQILGEIQEKGIRDQLVCSKLSSIAASLESYRNTIPEDCMEIKENISEYINDVAEADHFEFPNEIADSIRDFITRYF